MDFLNSFDFYENNETYEENKCCKMFEDMFEEIVLRFFNFLTHCCIGHCLSNGYSCNVLGINKFVEVRKKLFEFLDGHKKFIRLKKVVLKFDNSKEKRTIRVFFLFR